jgi:uncharacterized RDD family membrane protein YckC
MSESDNWLPPEPPTFNTEYESPFQQEPRAGFWMRFLAHICDGIMTTLVALPFALIGNLVSSDFSMLLQTLAIFGSLSYWIGTKGGSPLRRTLGVLVLDENDGSYIGVKRAAYRTLMSYVSGIALMLGYLSMLWNPKKQTWHDRVAQSVVVKR